MKSALLLATGLTFGVNSLVFAQTADPSASELTLTRGLDCVDFSGRYRFPPSCDFGSGALPEIRDIYQVGCETIYTLGSTIRIGTWQTERTGYEMGLVVEATTTSQWNADRTELFAEFSGGLIPVNGSNDGFSGSLRLRKNGESIEVQVTRNGETRSCVLIPVR